MKNKLTALALIAAAALSLAPKPAQASDKGLAVLGGFIGGVLVASELNQNHGYVTAPAVVVNSGYDRCDDGYWKDVTVRVWVPGCWVEERRYHGPSFRHFVDAHYEYRTDHVWVAYGRNVYGGYRR